MLEFVADNLFLLQKLALKINKVSKTVLLEGRSKMSEQNKPKDAEDILSEFDSRIKSSTEPPRDESCNTSSPELNDTPERIDQTLDQHTQTSEQASLDENIQESTSEIDKSDDHSNQLIDTPANDEPSTEPISSTASETDESAEEQRNVIFIGGKPLMAYVSATLTQLSICPTVIIKARGRRITQAVDVSQMILKRMNAVGYIISGIRISSMSLTSQDGKTRNVSTIEIDISKN